MSDTQADRLALKAATRQAHETLQDLRGAIREARAVLKEIQVAAEVEVDARVKPVIVAKINEMSTETRQAIDAAVAKVFAEFDLLADRLLGRDREGRRKYDASIPEMIDRRAAERQQRDEPPGPV